MFRLRTVLGLGLALCSGATVAAERGLETVELSWARSPDADSCISAAELKRTVRDRLGRDPFDGAIALGPAQQAPTQQQIEGTVSRQAHHWYADIVVRAPKLGRIGHRRLESAAADCRELDQAVVLTVTLIIDPNANLQPESAPAAATTKDQPKAATSAGTTSQSEIAQANSLAQTVTTEVVASASTQPATTPVQSAQFPTPALPTTPSVRAESALPSTRGAVVASHDQPPPTSSRLLLAPALFNRILPGPTWAGALRAELPVTPSLFAEVSAAFFPEVRVDYSQYEVGYGLTTLGTGLCYQPNRPIAPIACASGWAGVAHTVVYRGDPYQPGDRIWVGLRADAGIAANVERLVVELRALGMLPMTRWNFRVLNGRSLFQQPWVAPGIEVAVGLRLP